MATQTTNLGLTLPIGTEQVSRQVINANMELIDSAIGAVPEGENLQEEIEYVQEHVADLIDDTAGAGDDDKVWSADKTAAEVDKKANAIEMKIATPAAVMFFHDGAADAPMALELPLDPVQDLHGYDYPWPAGGGKNLNGMTLAECKEINTTGTWSNNVYTVDGVSFTVQTNSDGYITTITTSGSSENAQPIRCGKCSLKNGVSYIVSGCPSGGSSSKYEVMLTSAASGTASAKVHQYGSEASYTETEDAVRGIQIVIRAGQDATGLEFKPMIRLSTIADGTFEPYSNICPISGWTGAKVTRTGKNLVFKNEKALVNSSGAYGDTNNYKQFIAKVESGKTYIASGNTDKTGIIVAFFYDIPEVGDYSYNKSRTTSDEKTFTAPITGYASLRAAPSDTQVQIEEGTVASPYEAPAVEYPISWQTEAGTVYGGTLTVNKDGSAKLVVDSVGVDMSSLTWQNVSSNPLKFGAKLSYETQGGGSSFVGTSICDRYKFVKKSWLNLNDCEYNLGEKLAANRQWIVVRDTAYESYEDFAASLTNAIVVYSLASALEYPLSATDIRTLFGLNNVWADTGNINSVEYSADTKMYIDHLNDPTEDDFIANNNIAANEYFAIGNDLYRATQSIAVNDPIVPDTNCESLSLPEILNSFMTGSGVSF